jgi:hypothetical protein
MEALKMKLIEVARNQRDLLNEGIAWVAVWKQRQKNGKQSWFSEEIFPDGGVEHDEPIFDDEQKTRLGEILAIDKNAVLLNSYLHSWIGSADEPLGAMSISKGIENHYLMQNALIKHYLAGTMDTTESFPPIRREEFEFSNIAEREYAIEPDFTDLQLTEREELGLGVERRENFQGENAESLCGRMQASDIPETITIELPATNVNEEILRDLLNSKYSLIDAALGGDSAWDHEYGTDGLPLTDLPIEFADGKVKFEWLRFDGDKDAVEAWSAFLCAAVKYSATAKRVTAKDSNPENQKFAFRSFMVKIGMSNAQSKWARKWLLKNLHGDSAFATQESKDRWQAKHGKKAVVKEGDAE